MGYGPSKVKGSGQECPLHTFKAKGSRLPLLHKNVGRIFLQQRSVARAPPAPRNSPSAVRPIFTIFILADVHSSQTIRAGDVYAAGIRGRGRRPTFTAFMSSTLLAKYRYRRRLPHLQRADCDLFVTFCTGARMPLPGGARDLVLGHCLREHENRIRLYAAVVMPDHARCALAQTRSRWLAFSTGRYPAVYEKRYGSLHQQSLQSFRASLGGRVV